MSVSNEILAAIIGAIMTGAGVICTGGLGYLINRLIRAVDRLNKNIQELGTRLTVLETRFEDATSKRSIPKLVNPKTDEEDPTTTT